MGLARATRNLARTARANPMWALLGILLAPFRFARHIVGVVLFAMVLFGAVPPADAGDLVLRPR